MRMRSYAEKRVTEQIENTLKPLKIFSNILNAYLKFKIVNF